MRHRVAAHHHGNIRCGRQRPWMRHDTHSTRRNDAREILVRVYRGVPVVAHDPQVGLVPPAARLGVGSKSRRHGVHDRQRLTHECALVTTRMRRLVHARHRREHVIGAQFAHSTRNRRQHLPIDVEPALGAPAKVRECDAHGRARREGAMPARRCETSCDHAQRADAVRHQLEDRRRVRVEISVEARQLVADVAARVIGPSARAPCAIVPPNAGHADRTGKTPDEKGRVRRSRDGWKYRRHGMQAPLVAQPAQGREIAQVAFEGIKPRPVGDEHDYRQGERARG